MVRKIFNGANLFLFVLVIFVIINSLLSFSESKKSSPPIKKSFRVLSSNKDNFNQSIYFAKSGLEIFTITNPQVNLRIGSQYKIDALTKRYEYNSQNFNQSYFLSLGVTGQLELSKDSQLLVDQNCDWFCSILRRVDLLQKNIKKTYLNASCIEFAKINEFLNPKIKCQEVAALSSGLITGDTDGIEKSTNDNFKKLGLAHLVAVSGFQVVLLTSFLERILFKLSLPKYLRILLSVFSMLLLILLVGPQPPVLRSVMTLLIIYLALSLGRSVEYIRALIYSAIVLLFINPYYIYSISFQLSFLASFALGSNIFDQVDPTKFLIKFFKNLSSNILIFLFTLPILINLAGFVSPISIVVNLFLIPIIPIISILNIFGLIPILGSIFLLIPNIFQSFLLFFTNDVGPNIALLELQAFSLFEIFIYYFLLSCFVFTSKILLMNKKRAVIDSSESTKNLNE